MAIHKNLEKGDVVTIYEDPITGQKPEGKATLIKQLECAHDHPGNGSGYWRVKFANGDIRDRWVYTD